MLKSKKEVTILSYDRGNGKSKTVLCVMENGKIIEQTKENLKDINSILDAKYIFETVEMCSCILYPEYCVNMFFEEDENTDWMDCYLSGVDKILPKETISIEADSITVFLNAKDREDAQKKALVIHRRLKKENKIYNGYREGYISDLLVEE